MKQKLTEGHPERKARRIYFLILGFLFISNFLFAEHSTAPIDHPQETLIRRANDVQLNLTLTKNIFRTEYQDEWHTHPHYGDHHPGHDPSTWHEEYQEQEPYQDVEYYWDWEYYTDYESYREWVCPGDHHHHGGDCHWEWRRRPVTKRRWVQKSRVVTRWRTVTKIRLREFNDSHSHPVPVQVYDHTEGRDIKVLFPEAAILEGGEAEKFHILFDGQRVSINPESSYYTYQAVISQNEKDATIALYLRPLSKEEYGRNSIQDLNLKGEDGQAGVEFVDTKPFYKVYTSYFLEVIDENSKMIVDNAALPLNLSRQPFRTFLVPLVPGQGALGAFVRDFIKGDIDYLVRLKVIRQSVLFEGGQLEFMVELTRKGTLDPNLYGASSIAELRLVREDRSVYLVIADLKAGHEKVKTRYSIKISRSTWGIGTKVIGRAMWEGNGQETMKFLLKKGADNPIGRALEEHVEKGTEYDVRLGVDRESSLFPNGRMAFEMHREQKP